MDRISQLIGLVSGSFAASEQSAAVLLSVAAFAGCGLALYARTRGREFLLTGLSAAAFLLPLLKTH